MGKKPHRPEFDPLRFCEICGDIMRRRRSPAGRLEGMDKFLARRTCSRRCKRISLQAGQPAWRRGWGRDRS